MRKTLPSLWTLVGGQTESQPTRKKSMEEMRELPWSVDGRRSAMEEKK
jgi:hypothetical protein